MSATKTRPQVTLSAHLCEQYITILSGWSSSRSRPSILSSFRYVLEPGEYVWFLQADATLTNALIQSQYQNQTFFFEGSSNFSQFLVQGRPSPMCRNAVAMVRATIFNTAIFEPTHTFRLKRLTRSAKAIFTSALSELAYPPCSLMDPLGMLLWSSLHWISWTFIQHSTAP